LKISSPPPGKNRMNQIYLPSPTATTRLGLEKFCHEAGIKLAVVPPERRSCSHRGGRRRVPV
jgi:hypothetical protein